MDPERKVQKSKASVKASFKETQMKSKMQDLDSKLIDGSVHRKASGRTDELVEKASLK